jgi:hypothetical protein
MMGIEVKRLGKQRPDKLNSDQVAYSITSRVDGKRKFDFAFPVALICQNFPVMETSFGKFSSSDTLSFPRFIS